MWNRDITRLNLWAGMLTAIGAITWGVFGLLGINLAKRAYAASTGIERLLYAAIGIAGVWTGVALAIPKILVTLSLKAVVTAPERRFNPIEGRILPTVGGVTLSGKEVLLPSDGLGKVTLLIVGFSYDRRFETIKWLNAAMDRFRQDWEVDRYLVCIIPGIYGPISFLVDAWLRRVFPQERRNNILLAHGSVNSFRRALAASPIAHVWIYLLDRDGRVAFQRGGEFNERKFEDLLAAVEKQIRAKELATVEMRAKRLKAA